MQTTTNRRQTRRKTQRHGTFFALLLFLALQSGRLPLEAVKDAGKFLLEIMPLLFLPAAVGLMESWEVLRPVLLPFAVITVVSTVLVMGCSGRMTQAVIRRFSRKEAPHR